MLRAGVSVSVDPFDELEAPVGDVECDSKTVLVPTFPLHEIPDRPTVLPRPLDIARRFELNDQEVVLVIAANMNDEVGPPTPLTFRRPGRRLEIATSFTL